MISGIVDRVLALHGAAALAVVFLLPALEASAFVGFVFPGEVAALLAGVLAFQGRVPLWAAILAVVLGAIVGDTIGYGVGRRWGRGLLRGLLGRVPFLGRRVDQHLDRAEAFLQRRRGSAVFLGRFTTALRVLVPGLAGMSRIPFPVFAAYNVAGGVAWGTAFVLLGFSAGAAWRSVEAYATRFGLALLILVLLVLVAVRLFGAWRRAEAAERGPVARLRRRFPRPGAWVARRLDPASPTGAALSLAAVTTGVCLWIFAALAHDVVAGEEAANLDPSIATWFVDHRVAWVTSAMKVVTFLGSNAVLLPLAVGVGLVLWAVHRTWRPAALLLVSMGGAILLYRGFKAAVGRPRPPAWMHLVGVGGPAFPSGHATQSVACLAMLALILGSTVPSRRALASTWIVVPAAILLIGSSRLYLGVHWFTDILGGYALGGAWVGLLWSLRLALSIPLGSARSAPASPPRLGA